MSVPSAFHPIVDGFEKAFAVYDGDDDDPALLDAIDEPVAVDEALADVLVADSGTMRAANGKSAILRSRGFS